MDECKPLPYGPEGPGGADQHLDHGSDDEGAGAERSGTMGGAGGAGGALAALEMERTDTVRFGSVGQDCQLCLVRTGTCVLLCQYSMSCVAIIFGK